MTERERRVGLNEAIFRDVNERLRELNEAFTTLSDRMDLICECSNPDCTEHLSMTLTEYEALRADPRRFVVLPGHQEGPTIERVVERREGYAVVEKQGDAGRLAEESDPRDG